MNVLTKFFGLYDGSRSDQIAEMYGTLKSLYRQIASLKADLYALEHQPKVEEEDADKFLSNLVNNVYPGFEYSYMDANTPPPTMDISTACTSFFYSDGSGRPLYVDAPLHSWMLRLSRQGIMSVINTSIGMFPRNYRHVNASDDYLPSGKFGHPHCLNSDEEREVTGSWCFGNNTGVDDLLRTANDLASIGILFRKLYHWMTEINVDSIYHSNVFPLRLRYSSDVWDDAKSFGSIIKVTYKECFSEAIELFNAGKYTDFKRDMLFPLRDAFSHALIDIEPTRHFANFLRNEIAVLESLAYKEPYMFAWVLCLYQFATTCILADTGGQAISALVRNAMEADLLYIPYAWGEYTSGRFMFNNTHERPNYEKTFRHYFDAFDYTLKGGF